MNKTLEEIIKKDLMELMGLQNLSDQEKVDLYNKALETIQNRVLIRIVAKLGEDNKEQFFQLIDKEDEKAIDDYLQSKNIDYRALFSEEVLLYKLEMAKKTEAIKEK